MRSDLERTYRRRRFLRWPNESFYEIDEALSWSSESRRAAEDSYWQAHEAFRTPGEAFYHTR